MEVIFTPITQKMTRDAKKWRLPQSPRLYLHIPFAQNHAALAWILHRTMPYFRNPQDQLRASKPQPPIHKNQKTVEACRPKWCDESHIETKTVTTITSKSSYFEKNKTPTPFYRRANELGMLTYKSKSHPPQRKEAR